MKKLPKTYVCKMTIFMEILRIIKVYINDANIMHIQHDCRIFDGEGRSRFGPARVVFVIMREMLYSISGTIH